MATLPKFHRPVAYRYEVAFPARFRPTINRYGWQIIGVAVTVGRHAYCVKWAWAA